MVKLSSSSLFLLSSVLLTSASFQSGLAQDLQSGYARIEGSSAVISSLYSFRNPQDVLISEAAVGAVPPLLRARIFVDQRQGETGLALVNAEDGMTELELILRDAAGSEVRHSNLQLPPLGQESQFISQLFDDLPEGFIGSLELNSQDGQSRFAALTIRSSSNPYDEPLFATLPVVPLEIAPNGENAASSLILPQVGGGEAGASVLTTQILLLERSGSRIEGRIQFVASSGAPLPLELDGETGSEFPFAIPANGVLALDFSSPQGLSQGYARIELTSGDVLPGATAVFQFRRSDGRLVSEAGVPATPMAMQARAFLDNVLTQMGIAVALPESTAVSALTFRLRDRQGRVLETVQRMIPGGGHLAIFAGELFANLPPSFTGSLEVEGPSPMSVIALKLTTTERRDPILTSLPVATGGGDANLLFLPQIGYGQGAGVSIATRLLVLDPGQAGAGVTLLFLDPAGEELEVPLAGEMASRIDSQLPPSGSAQFRPGNRALPARILVADPGSVVPRFDVSTGQEFSLEVGDSGTFRPLVLDSEGQARDDFPVDFLSLDGAVLNVGTQGGFQALEKGFATVSLGVQGVLGNLQFSVLDVVQTGSGYEVGGIAVDRSGILYLAGPESHVILRTPGAGLMPEVWAGQQGSPGFEDSLRGESLFNGPSFLDLDVALGKVFVSDRNNHLIRQIQIGPGGRVNTVAGTEAGALDGPLAQARFDYPAGVALDGKGRLWVADSGNHTIRLIDFARGEVITVAGQAGEPGLVDGKGNTARFRSPFGLALVQETLDQALQRQLRGEPPPPVKVLVADRGNGLLRSVDENAEVVTLQGVESSAVNGVAPQDPRDLSSDAAGNLFIVEGDDRLILRLRNGAEPVVNPKIFEQPRSVRVPRLGRLLVGGLNSTYEADYAPPEIESLDPSEISDQGGETVRIEGRNFAPESVVIIADRVIDGAFMDSRHLEFVTPVLPSGLTTLTVFHRGGLAQTSILVEAVPFSSLAPGTITTVMGGATFGGDGGPADRAVLDSPTDVALDGLGNLFIVERDRHRVRRVDARTGIINTWAGNGTPGFSGDGGPALAAAFCFPENLALGPDGELLVSDTGNNRVRRVDPVSLRVSTLAGSAPLFTSCANNPEFAGDGGPAVEARLASPRGIVALTDGSVIFADGASSRVRQILPDGTIDTLVGTGVPGYSGDGGPANQAQLGARVFGLGLEPDEAHLLIADRSNQAVRQVELAGQTITTEAGSGIPGFGGDGGPALDAELNFPRSVAATLASLWIADSGNQRIRRVDRASGIIETVAGEGTAGFSGDGGPALDAQLNDPWSITPDSSGNLLIADSENNRIREIRPDGTIHTLAGSMTGPFSDIGQPAAAAQLLFPGAIAFDPAGNLLVLDRSNRRLLRLDRITGLLERVTGDGTATGIGDGGPALDASLSNPQGLALDESGNIYLSDEHRIRRIDAGSGLIEVAVGQFFFGFVGDGGSPLDAELNTPEGLAFDNQGRLLIADSGNSRVRRVDFTDDRIETIAGSGSREFSGDGGDPLLAGLGRPAALVVDSLGNVYFSEPTHQRIRVIRVGSNTIHTLAGSGEVGYEGDGGPAELASLNGPRQLTLVGNRYLLVADSFNRRLRVIDLQDDTIDTLAGNGSTASTGDNGLAVDAAIGFPFALAADEDGNVYFSDVFNQRVRAIRQPFNP